MIDPTPWRLEEVELPEIALRLLWCGGMLESGVGWAHNVALAAFPGFSLPGDISASRRYWDQDVVEPAL